MYVYELFYIFLIYGGRTHLIGIFGGHAPKLVKGKIITKVFIFLGVFIDLCLWAGLEQRVSGKFRPYLTVYIDCLHGVIDSFPRDRNNVRGVNSYLVFSEKAPCPKQLFIGILAFE